MKDVRCLLLGLTIGLAALAPPWMVTGALASVVRGTPTFVGILPVDNFTAVARVRIDGMCDNQQLNNLYIIIHSGSLNSALTEANSLTMKNAYSTLLTALLSGKSLQFFGVMSCIPNPAGEVFLDLPTGDVSIF